MYLHTCLSGLTYVVIMPSNNILYLPNYMRFCYSYGSFFGYPFFLFSFFLGGGIAFCCGELQLSRLFVPSYVRLSKSLILNRLDRLDRLGRLVSQPAS